MSLITKYSASDVLDETAAQAEYQWFFCDGLRESRLKNEGREARFINSVSYAIGKTHISPDDPAAQYYLQSEVGALPDTAQEIHKLYAGYDPSAGDSGEWMLFEDLSGEVTFKNRLISQNIQLPRITIGAFRTLPELLIEMRRREFDAICKYKEGLPGVQFITTDRDIEDQIYDHDHWYQVAKRHDINLPPMPLLLVILTIHNCFRRQKLLKAKSLHYKIEYFKNGGILHYVLRSMTKAA